MGLTINIQRGGLSRKSTNTDTWGGLFIEVDALPVGWTANEVKPVFRPEDLEEYGISEDSVNVNYQLVYWHVSEVFRLAPNSSLWVQLGVPASSGTLPATFIPAFQQANNNLRLFGVVLSTTTIATAEVDLLQTALDSIFTDSIQPARAVVSYKKDAGELIPDFSTEDNFRVMVDIANDATAGGLAKSIFDSALGMCGAAGTHLGQLLRLSVHQKPSWASFPINDSGRWSLLADINGDSVETKTEAEKALYKTQGLNLVTRLLLSTDAYISNARTAGVTTDDFAIITHGRVIDKAAVLLYDALLRFLNGPVYTDVSTGLIAEQDRVLIQRIAYEAINNNMVLGKVGTAVEIAVDSNTGSFALDSVFVDPDQDILQTETLSVEVRITPVGAASSIVINLGLKLP